MLAGPVAESPCTDPLDAAMASLGADNRAAQARKNLQRFPRIAWPHIYMHIFIYIYKLIGP